MSDEAPKSALELALARLKQKDAEAGVVETPLTDEQRAAIAEARNVHDARLAETKILHRSAAMGVGDPAERERLEDEHRRDVQRLADERDRKITRIREGR